jgi:hypothetical protein
MQDHSDTSINSRMKKSDRTLAHVSPAQAERFLTELVNLRKDAVGRFQSRFAHMIPDNFSFRLVEIITSFGSDPIRLSEEETAEYGRMRLFKELIENVRRVWAEPDLRTKQYGVFLIWQWAIFGPSGPLGQSRIEIPAKLPPPTPFEEALQYLLNEASRETYCQNPDCLAPYYFAKRRSQRYCSDACAKPAQREFKRQWWAEHGEEWRAQKQGKKTSKKGRK